MSNTTQTKHPIQRSAQRGYADHGWLKAFHSFSFAHYYDPKRMGFGPLRVINEDRVAPNMGFGMHGHQNMEIITVILKGSLMHRDSMGNEGVIGAGQVQKMSAGKGVRHSEMNPETELTTHLLQIWVEPNVQDIEPEYEQYDVDELPLWDGWRVIAANVAATNTAWQGQANAMRLYQDAIVLLAQSDDGSATPTVTRSYTLTAGRIAYIHVATGAVHINGESLQAGDAIEISVAEVLNLELGADTQVLLFDMVA